MLSLDRPRATRLTVSLAIVLFAGAAFAAEPPVVSFWEQTESVSVVTFSADGKQLVTAGGNLQTGYVAFWNLDTMTRAVRLTDTGMVRAMAISPDGKTLCVHATVLLGDRSTLSKVRTFDVTSGKPIAEIESLPKQAGATGAMLFSADGKQLVLGRGDGTVTLHNPATGKLTATLRVGSDAAWALALSSDGKTQAVGGQGPTGVQLWDIAEEKVRATIPVGQFYVAALAYSPDGKTLVAGTGRDHETPGELVVWDVTEGKIKDRWKGHDGPVVSVHFSRDGQYVASGARSSDIKLWDAKTGKELRELTGPLNLSRVAFAPDGKTLAVSGGTGDVFISSGGVRLWDVPSGRERLPPKAAAERDRREAALRRTAAEQAQARAVRDRDPNVATERARRAEYALAIHVANDHAARWQFAQARKLLDGLRPAKGESDLRGLEWHLLDARLPRFTELCDGKPARHATFSPDGTRIAAAVGVSVHMFDAATGKPLFECKGSRNSAGILFSPNGKSIAVVDSSANAVGTDVKVVDARTGKDIVSLSGHPGGVKGFAFSPDGTQLAAAVGASIHMFDAATGKPLFECKGFRNSPGKMLFSPNGKFIAVVDYSANAAVSDVKVVDAHTGGHRFTVGAPRRC
ncbi:PQQ-binding-like beta-propeller repeat protein [Fimbriiglobus ruber]|uniref:High-affnity carbon uptake protein Hat/HatR n=1 Tax=Fimbriiglobus ruber TaxID=1908690 RepID=A0A225DQ76_9BACT|nr:PQQ-binding-like beta-propeller repeat protein [Fimbriiglobus ruber]OWK39339.1 High-affnity carbon uptake protein Hat/HatR [Fimbriiglobus ruber]